MKLLLQVHFFKKVVPFFCEKKEEQDSIFPPLSPTLQFSVFSFDLRRLPPLFPLLSFFARSHEEEDEEDGDEYLFFSFAFNFACLPASRHRQGGREQRLADTAANKEKYFQDLRSYIYCIKLANNYFMVYYFFAEG